MCTATSVLIRPVTFCVSLSSSEVITESTLLLPFRVVVETTPGMDVTVPGLIHPTTRELCQPTVVLFRCSQSEVITESTLLSGRFPELLQRATPDMDVTVPV